MRSVCGLVVAACASTTPATPPARSASDWDLESALSPEPEFAETAPEVDSRAASAPASRSAATASPSPSALPPPLLPAPTPSPVQKTERSPATAQLPADGDVPESACPARAGKNAVRRSALSQTLDAGLGTWLRGVEVEAKIERGHFQGWLVRGLFVGDPCWSDVGLQVGDVIHRINHHAIEKPEQAHAVWTALRSAPEISVDFIRGGQVRTLTFAVVDDGNRGRSSP